MSVSSANNSIGFQQIKDSRVGAADDVEDMPATFDDSLT